MNKYYLPDILELNLKSKTINTLFTEVAELILKSSKIVDSVAAVNEFKNLEKFWSKKGYELIEKEKDFYPEGVFPLCINYCSFIDASGSLMFLGRSNEGIDIQTEKLPPAKVICFVLFHSIESYQNLDHRDAEKEKINLYWNNLLKNQNFLNRFLSLKDVTEFQKTTEEILGFSEKRKHPRFKTSEFAYCAMFGTNTEKDKKETARIVDISLSGFLLEHMSPYTLNSILEIEPFLDNEKLYLCGKVCRTQKYGTEDGIKFTSGINITNISEFDETILNKYLGNLSPLTQLKNSQQ
ncbi:MAG: hypothetical protein A3C43_08920 [Candidatus Schekmanbacteria bacterium RIFCSPHIGHO2_02_FULL_38_11]|uniref:PilZ domain-containing protein n=1 Tax=Candidatus Schekmanbacteria bacterium RIFCSPLOWO2_12_FULL_38_15 TaxID=1817883 RepID=A0A1F7SLB6_9BACT|nr:MAG: hypothetical protein A2043_09080 [Candidatus Schekmanbacteria bacterium GWA2_38_9]OGL47952.1 MAG: hypothetical protein A3H37_07955 [Candidatus Schekmanbacteria bacterium RIFCSPLOWO2_02_FULL_38_14]OGL49031.1 MAG: hypothetical protein A3C43_08920 [Candidatus Schekmanbacteria bacterium RIFCSPHIGHO2_02_FULL_38_11]OGL54563.1 MAG: hypothetical protein A3G31_10435 [Candidatus Schekmanbacteria bacterium RIFCSPLOWO2_12_FULL_38_15]